jgi:hypothetical protein
MLRRFTLISIGFILVATLFPESGDAGRALTCILCNERSIADALLNVALFIPLGMALRRSRMSLRRLVALAALLSAGIEAAQLVIPGRDPNLSDVVFNSLGSLLGAALDQWLRATKPWQRISPVPLISLAIANALLVLSVAAALLSPSFPRRTYFGQWTPQFENMDHYDGSIIDARIDQVHLPNQAVGDSTVRARLLAGKTLTVAFTAGRAPVRTAPIFNLYDDEAREIITLSARRADLMIRYRTRAAAFHLDQPIFKLANALASTPRGQPTLVRLRLVHGGICAQVDELRYCPMGVTPAGTSNVLLRIASSEVLDRLFGLCWLALLFFPAGLAAQKTKHAALATVVSCAALALLPQLFNLLGAPLIDLCAVAIGIAAGATTRRRYVQRRE